MSYKTSQKKYLKEVDLRQGDYVKVTRKAFRGEGDWVEDWFDRMNSSIGVTNVLFEIDFDNRGLVVNGYLYPYFVIEKIRDRDWNSLLRINLDFSSLQTTKEEQLIILSLFDSVFALNQQEIIQLLELIHI